MLSGVRAGLGTIRLAVSLVASSGRRYLVAILVATVVTSVALAGELLVGGQLLDLIAEGSDGRDVAPYLVALGALLVVSALSQALAAELRLPLSERVYRTAMDQVLETAAEVEVEQFERAEFFDRLDRAVDATGEQSTAVVFGLVAILSTAIVAMGVVVVLVSVEPLLVPIVMVGYVPVAVVNARNTRAAYQLEVELTEVEREREYLEDLLTDRSAANDVRSFDLAPALRAWHTGFSDIRVEQMTRLVRQRLARLTGGTIVTTLVLIGALSFTVVLATRGTITLGDAAIAIVGLQQLNGRVHILGGAMDSVHGGVEFLRDFERFRATIPMMQTSRTTSVPPAPPDELEIDEVRYRYPGSEVDAVGPLSLGVRRGQVLAIVGANGSGKTTLAKVICGLLPPSAGAVRWDGVDLSSCDPFSVRSQIAPVHQDYPHLNFTIREAIGLGDVERLDEVAAIRSAADQAGLSVLIDGLPLGLDTRLGKEFTNGIDLSIGQWQRLSIARALFRGAPIMVFDEPSAALDPRAEMALFDTMQQMSDGRIVIFISHRFATVRDADLVAVLDEGSLVELGSHDELMDHHGLYADLFTIQAERYGDGPRRGS